MSKLIVASVVILATSVLSQDTIYDFLMPNVYPSHDELYLCTATKVSNENFYIVGFQPNATMHTAHHMLLFGCSEPGSNDAVWNCGKMHANEANNMYNTSEHCKSESQVIYAWARDAPALQMPEGVGFHIGKDSPIKYMVLQVHYMHKFPEGKTDNSGVFVYLTKTPMPRQAGVLVIKSRGEIAPNSVVHMETACTMREHKVIHPFAFRTHTHALGKVVSGWRVRKNVNGDEWQLIGKQNPQLPQMFYPVASYDTIGEGDIVATRCTMNNPHNHVVRIGQTNKDEMCTYYLMYWVEQDTPLGVKFCFSDGPPSYYWRTAGFTRIPDIDASTL